MLLLRGLRAAPASLVRVSIVVDDYAIGYVALSRHHLTKVLRYQGAL